MNSQHQRLIHLWALLWVSALFARAQSVTQISGTIEEPGGSLFTGSASFQLSNGISVPDNMQPESTISISNGALKLLIHPSVTDPAGPYYVVTYRSSDSHSSWIELWRVPVSLTPLNISNVLLSRFQVTAPGNSSTSQAPRSLSSKQMPILISDVVNLTEELGRLNSAVNGINTSLSGLKSLSTTTVAQGTRLDQDGIQLNSISTALAQAAQDISSLKSSFGGLSSQLASVTSSLSGLALPSPTPNFVDSETPKGDINGANLSFSLAAAPKPPSSLHVYKNGLLLKEQVDYALNGGIITFVGPGVAPGTGDTLVTSYRY